jgi:ribosomal protein S18 acetylase RimI-like enzyme
MTNSASVQRLGAGDAGEVVRAAGLFDEPNDVAAVQAYLCDDRNVVFMAYDGDQPVGFLRGTALDQLKSQHKQMFLYEIAVEERHRRLGIGAGLIESLVRYCRERNFEEIFVLTDPDNLPAVRLYTSTGAITETAGDRMYVYRL